MKQLKRHLRRDRKLSNVWAITTAKVPIVKFYEVRSDLTGKISLYNSLVSNEKLLFFSKLFYLK